MCIRDSSNTLNSFGEIALVLKKLENFQRMYWSVPFLPPSSFVFCNGCSFLRYCLQRAVNCPNCSSSPSLSTFKLNLYILRRLPSVQCAKIKKQQRQQRKQRKMFTYSTTSGSSALVSLGEEGVGLLMLSLLVQK